MIRCERPQFPRLHRPPCQPLRWRVRLAGSWSAPGGREHRGPNPEKYLPGGHSLVRPFPLGMWSRQGSEGFGARLPSADLGGARAGGGPPWTLRSSRASYVAGRLLCLRVSGRAPTTAAGWWPDPGAGARSPFSQRGILRSCPCARRTYRRNRRLERPCHSARGSSQPRKYRCDPVSAAARDPAARSGDRS